MVARRPRTRVEALERIAILAESYAAKDPILLGAFEVLRDIEDETEKMKEALKRPCVECGNRFVAYGQDRFCSIGCQIGVK